MRFSLLTLGKCKYSFWQEAQAHYQKAIKSYAELEVLELRDQAGDPKREAEVLGNAWEKRSQTGGARLIVLDERGREFSSMEFSKELGRWRDQGVRDAVFLVGGPYGVAPELKERASLQICLGRMTLPHDLARVVALEQIYRALSIEAGSKYHHA